MKKIICVFAIIILIILPSRVVGNSEDIDQETIEEQQEEFKIQNFIKNANEYTGEFFEDIDVNKILNDAIQGRIDNSTLLKRIWNLFGKEVKSGINAIVSVLVVVVIHSILKSISDSLEDNGISKLIYYVQYILIITIIMNNFSDIVQMVKDTTTNLVAFMNMLVPLLVSLMLYTGNITTSGLLEPIILFMINFIGNIIQNLIIPFVFILVSFIIISKLTDRVQINKIAKKMKSSIVWLLGIILTVFVGVVSLEGTLSSSVDGITAKTAKSMVTSVIPVVGKILGDAVDTVLGCGIILKNAIGIVGVIIILGICIMPIIKLTILTFSYKLLSSVCEPIADSKVVDLLEQIGDIFKILLAILSAISAMLIIGTALVVKISNSGMMYR